MATDPPLDDASLVRLVQTGKSTEAAAAFDELYWRHNSRLLLHLQRKGLTSDQQREVTHATWVRAWEKISKFEDRGVDLFPWLRRIADFVAKEHFKKYTLEARRKERDISDTDQMSDIADPALPVIEQLSSRELREIVQQILSEAPNEDYKTLVHAMFFVGFKPEEIGEYYGWTMSKVYTTTHRAIAWLKPKLMDRYGPEIMNNWFA